MNQGSTMASSAKSGKQGSKGWLIVVVAAFGFILIVCSVVLSIYGVIQNAEQNDRISELTRLIQQRDIEEGAFDYIQYSSSGGYGTRAQTAKITVVFSSDGKVELTNDYDAELKESFQVDPKDYKRLNDYIDSHMGVFSIKERENNDILDGGRDYITIKKKSDSEEYETGGYGAINDDEFAQMVSEIVKAIGEEKYNSYSRTVHNLE